MSLRGGGRGCLRTLEGGAGRLLPLAPLSGQPSSNAASRPAPAMISQEAKAPAQAAIVQSRPPRAAAAAPRSMVTGCARWWVGAIWRIAPKEMEGSKQAGGDNQVRAGQQARATRTGCALLMAPATDTVHAATHLGTRSRATSRRTLSVAAGSGGGGAQARRVHVVLEAASLCCCLFLALPGPPDRICCSLAPCGNSIRRDGGCTRAPGAAPCPPRGGGGHGKRPRSRPGCAAPGPCPWRLCWPGRRSPRGCSRAYPPPGYAAPPALAAAAPAAVA